MEDEKKKELMRAALYYIGAIFVIFLIYIAVLHKSFVASQNYKDGIIKRTYKIDSLAREINGLKAVSYSLIVDNARLKRGAVKLEQELTKQRAQYGEIVKKMRGLNANDAILEFDQRTNK
jgi:hypothetical protein